MGDVRQDVTKGSGQFTTTHWSVVLNAAAGASPLADEALEKLCTAYWKPLYGYIRGRGYTEADAEDLTQEFFARLLAKQFLSGVHSGKGKFRCFLLASVKHFLANQWDRATALKRGGRQPLLPYDGAAEEYFAGDAQEEVYPEATFDRQWALAVLEQAMRSLKQEYATAGKLEQFERLKRFLSSGASQEDYERVAAEIGGSAGAVGVSVHRLRQRYREQLRSAIANTVSDPGELEDEMHYLFGVLNA